MLTGANLRRFAPVLIDRAGRDCYDEPLRASKKGQMYHRKEANVLTLILQPEVPARGQEGSACLLSR
jgi:hypothetical protein